MANGGFIDPNAREVIPGKYDEVHDYFDGRAVVELDGMSGIIDWTGKEVVPCQYGYINYEKGLYKVEFDGFCGSWTGMVAKCFLANILEPLLSRMSLCVWGWKTARMTFSGRLCRVSNNAVMSPRVALIGLRTAVLFTNN